MRVRISGPVFFVQQKYNLAFKCRVFSQIIWCLPFSILNQPDSKRNAQLIESIQIRFVFWYRVPTLIGLKNGFIDYTAKVSFPANRER